VRAAAQTGKNAIFDSGGNCSPCASSRAFIDATVFTGKPPSNDLCSVLNWVLVNIVQLTYPQGAVIDARGLPAKGTSMSCSTGQPSPWAGIASPPPSTILLPATGSTPIKIPSTWVLPNYTVLIGEGKGISTEPQSRALVILIARTEVVAQFSVCRPAEAVSGTSRFCTNSDHRRKPQLRSRLRHLQTQAWTDRVESVVQGHRYCERRTRRQLRTIGTKQCARQDHLFHQSSD
jgi:hypothetical protein